MKFAITILAIITSTISAIAQGQIVCRDTVFVYTVILEKTPSEDSFSYNCLAKTITIKRRTDNKVIQEIQVPETDIPCTFSEGPIFIVEDMNFDGKNDFRLMQFLPTAPNIPFYYWTFDERSQQFKQDTTLEEITSPDFHPDNKTITSFWRASCCHHGLSTYKYIKGKLTLVEESEVFRDEDDFSKIITTTKKRIRNKMKLVDKTVEIDTDYKKE